MASRKRSISSDSDVSPPYKEWNEALCPICMDHPHNAVLLICSSHDKSCHPYICDTSYRHSNCLDRFKKLKEENVDSLSATSLVPESQQDSMNSSGGNLDLTTLDHANLMQTESNSIPEGSGRSSPHEANSDFEEREGRLWGSLDLAETNMEKLAELNLRCPLCRGRVLGWKVVEEARKYLNLKCRSCSHESCSFFGNYKELRQHARRVHPTVHPADVDSSREGAWRRLEDQREYGDIVSAVRSAMPGAVVVGDYAIESRDRPFGGRERISGTGEDGRLLSTLLFLQMFGSLGPGSELRGGRSRAFPRYHRAGGTSSRRRHLWGENLFARQDDNEEDEDDEPDLNIPSDLGANNPPNPRRRRRLTHAQSDEDQ